MFVVYDWPFPRMDFAKNVADIIFHLNSWLCFQRLCRLLWRCNTFSNPQPVKSLQQWADVVATTGGK